jgi:hypothetical protein
MKRSIKKLIFNFRYVLIFLVLIISLVIFTFKNHTKTCAKIVEKSKTNSCITIVYEFKVNNKIRNGRMDIGILKDEISYDSMQKIDCIEIEYSNILSNINWISDNRIVK